MTRFFPFRELTLEAIKASRMAAWPLSSTPPGTTLSDPIPSCTYRECRKKESVHVRQRHFPKIPSTTSIVVGSMGKNVSHKFFFFFNHSRVHEIATKISRNPSDPYDFFVIPLHRKSRVFRKQHRETERPGEQDERSKGSDRETTYTGCVAQ